MLVDAFKGVLPFLVVNLIRIVLPAFFRIISLYLVYAFGGKRSAGELLR